jgi:hypothetical protein
MKAIVKNVEINSRVVDENDHDTFCNDMADNRNHEIEVWPDNETWFSDSDGWHYHISWLEFVQ